MTGRPAACWATCWLREQHVGSGHIFARLPARKGECGERSHDGAQEDQWPARCLNIRIAPIEIESDGCPFHQSLLPLVGTTATDHDRQRPQHQPYVLPQAPVHYVQVVELHHLLERDPRPTEHLPVPGDPRREVEASSRPALDVLVLGRDQGRGPTRLISPRTTFQSCGSSSRLDRRSQRPMRVTRGSWSSFSHPGLGALGDELRAALLGVDGHRSQLVERGSDDQPGRLAPGQRTPDRANRA